MQSISPEVPSAAAETPRLVRGQIIAQKYVLVQEIGSGGMGVVWRAERLDLRGATCALKVLKAPKSRGALERFEREVVLPAQLNSEHIVHIYEHGIDAALQLPFIAMRLLHGQTLERRLHQLKTLSPGEVALVLTGVGKAVASAHALGIIHRDLKPGNIFLVDNGDDIVPKVLDFGLAKAIDGDLLESRPLTMQGAGVGTPGYMSPEQLGGLGNDRFGDLWSLAVIAYECLVGKRPFGPGVIGERPVPSRQGNVPPGFDAWFAKATDPIIARRYQTVEDLVEGLRRVCRSCRKPVPKLDYQRIQSPGLSSLAPVSSPPITRAFFARWHYGVLALGIALSLAGLGLNVYPFVRPTNPVAPTARGAASAPEAPPPPTAAAVAVPALTPAKVAVVVAEAPQTAAPSGPEVTPAATSLMTEAATPAPITSQPKQARRSKPHRAAKKPSPAPAATSERVGELPLFPDL
jgi:eukaryotic-like serine/threonine-protein kinase